jgi:hypothetical protein
MFKSKKVSLIATLLWAISPFGIFFDRMALVDSLLNMLGIWTLFSGILVVKYKRLDTAMLTGFALGAALITKSSGAFFAALLPATFIISEWKGKTEKQIIALLRLIFLFLITFVISFAIYNILRLGPNFSLIQSRNQDYVLPITHIFSSPLDPFIPYLDRSKEWLLVLGPFELVILFLLGAIFNFKTKTKEIVILLVFALVPIFLQAEFAKVMTARYILFTFPYFIVLASSVFLHRQKILNFVAHMFLIIFIFHSLSINFLLLTAPDKAPLPRSERSGYLEEWTAGTGIKEISNYIKREHLKDPQIKIVAGTEGYFGTLPDGLQMYEEGIPNVVIIGIGLSIDDVPTPLKEAKKFGDKVYLVINDSRFKYKGNPEDIGLKLLASYKKAERPSFVREYVQFGPREHLLFFEVTKVIERSRSTAPKQSIN